MFSPNTLSCRFHASPVPGVTVTFGAAKYFTSDKVRYFTSQSNTVALRHFINVHWGRFFLHGFLYLTNTFSLQNFQRFQLRQAGRVFPLRTIGFAPVLNDKRAAAMFEFSIRCAVPLVRTCPKGNARHQACLANSYLYSVLFTIFLYIYVYYSLFMYFYTLFMNILIDYPSCIHYTVPIFVSR